MNLCKDCLHLRDGNCVHPVNVEDGTPDFVNGGNLTRPKWYAAQRCREDKGSCGAEGHWFEPKP